MSVLSPILSSKIASHVYSVRQNSLEDSAKIATAMGVSEHFNIGSGKHLSGDSGVLFLKKKSGFGYVSKGIGRRQDEILISLRGTESAGDWLTDGNFSLQKGPSGTYVHGGFNDTFNSLIADIEHYLKGKNPSVIHCVGHSLGGALATLTADHFSEKKTAKIQLYTYGCPRVGTSSFTKNLTGKLGTENVFRVHHNADPVSMIPIFPFSHVPVAGGVWEIPWTSTFSFAAHKMGNYVSSVGNASGWNGLRKHPPHLLEKDIKRWLEASQHGDFGTLSSTTLMMIGKALGWIIRKIAGVIVGTAATACMTVLDRIAWLLAQGYRSSTEMASYVTALIRQIFRFLGRPFSSSTNITTAFLRWVLDLLFTTVRNAASLAIRRTPFI